MSVDVAVLGPVIAVLAVMAALLAVLKVLKNKGKSFTFRVFTALGLGVVFGVVIQMTLGRGTEAAKVALDWISCPA